MSGKLRCTEEEFFHYIRCPIHYDTIYRRRFSPTAQITLASCLQRVERRFYASIIDLNLMTTGQIKKCWDGICEKNQDSLTPQKCIDGFGQLMKMYRWAEKEELIVIDQSVPYTIGIPAKNGRRIEFSGHIDTIAVDKKKQPYLLWMDFSNRYPLQSFLDMKLKITLDIMGMYEVYNRQVGAKIHHVKHDKDFFTFRKEEDFNRVKTSIANVVFAIENNVFYPRESTFCTSCDMLNYCRAWP